MLFYISENRIAVNVIFKIDAVNIYNYNGISVLFSKDVAVLVVQIVDLYAYYPHIYCYTYVRTHYLHFYILLIFLFVFTMHRNKCINHDRYFTYEIKSNI